MISKPRKFFAGAVLLVAFLVVLVALFLPLFDGLNALDYMDSLYNSISKGSAYFIPELREESAEYRDTKVEFVLAVPETARAAEIRVLLEATGSAVSPAGAGIRVAGDLAGILARCLDDADDMYANNGSALRQRYGYDERRVLYDWWTVVNTLDQELKRQKRFTDAAFVHKVEAKAVECAYNYYTVEPFRVVDKIGIVILSLEFYVISTVWYGYAIIFLFEGWGLQLSH